MTYDHKQYMKDYWAKNKEALSVKRKAKYAEDPLHNEKTRQRNSATQVRYRGIQETSPKINLARMASQAKGREGGNITTSFLMNMWIEQGGKCALTGYEMNWGGGVVDSMNVSIDRIDQRQGYFQDNVRLVCWCVNSFRQKMSDQQLLEVAKALVDTLQAKLDSEQIIAKVTCSPLEMRSFI
jgi:hypothetical protein